MKKKLLISFSGGETSAYMIYFLTNIWQDIHKWEYVVVFANTGEENEETLQFVEDCRKLFNCKITWVEASVNEGLRQGTTHKIVDFRTASREGEPFEAMIKKFGIPNQNYPHCNRELKLRPIHSYVKRELGWQDYYTAIGIRYDEIDRVSVHREKNKIIYPLIEFKKMTKQKINFWWSQQEFRLNLKGYQTNCKTCWKKSFRTLYKISQESPEDFYFFKTIEEKYSLMTPPGREILHDENGNIKPYTFFREGKSVDEIFKEAENFNGIIRDKHNEINFQLDLFSDLDEVESCDIFSNCGDL